ncbi:hypothetical protein PROFUN_07679 [Planoprotostelium fungivorum]|uniref:Uncharacterized protein n=1 Tax=Planoprotostelium fungivorum TaxID=1890364 RepID=A0A2P6MM44_9EUKA|nr:hypothetical protein PROFUN_07679 [Planoprotostelium fungivorum]
MYLSSAIVQGISTVLMVWEAFLSVGIFTHTTPMTLLSHGITVFCFGSYNVLTAVLSSTNDKRKSSQVLELSNTLIVMASAVLLAMTQSTWTLYTMTIILAGVVASIIRTHNWINNGCKSPELELPLVNKPRSSSSPVKSQAAQPISSMRWSMSIDNPARSMVYLPALVRTD